MKEAAETHADGKSWGSKSSWASEVKRVGFGGYKDGLWTHMPGLP